jgi:hypothetical protein
MDRQILIDNILHNINQLTDLQVIEINDFAEFLLSKMDDKIIRDGIQELTSDSECFTFLKEDEDLYSVNDLKERYK